MIEIQQNSTARGIPLPCYSQNTAVSSVTPTLKIKSSPSSSGTTPSGTITASDSGGWAMLTPASGDFGTAGYFGLEVSGSGIDTVTLPIKVVAWDPFTGQNVNGYSSGNAPPSASSIAVVVAENILVNPSNLLYTDDSGNTSVGYFNGTAITLVSGNLVVAAYDDTGASIHTALGTVQTSINNIASGTTVVRANNSAGATIPSGTAQSGDAYAYLGTNLGSTGANLRLAKGTQVTGFNDIAAGTQMDLVNAPNSTALAAIATKFWTDTTSSDFTVSGSIGKVIFAQLGGAFTSGTSIFTVSALQNAPSGGGGGGGATVAEIVAALAGTTMSVVSNVGNGFLAIVQGAAYNGSYNNLLTFTAPANVTWPSDLTDWTITLTASIVPGNPNAGAASVDWTMAAAVPTGSQELTLTLTSAQTSLLAYGEYDFVIWGQPQDSSDEVALMIGRMQVA